MFAKWTIINLEMETGSNHVLISCILYSYRYYFVNYINMISIVIHNVMYYLDTEAATNHVCAVEIFTTRICRVRCNVLWLKFLQIKHKKKSFSKKKKKKGFRQKKGKKKVCRKKD